MIDTESRDVKYSSWRLDWIYNPVETVLQYGRPPHFSLKLTGGLKLENPSEFSHPKSSPTFIERKRRGVSLHASPKRTASKLRKCKHGGCNTAKLFEQRSETQIPGNEWASPITAAASRVPHILPIRSRFLGCSRRGLQLMGNEGRRPPLCLQEDPC